MSRSGTPCLPPPYDQVIGTKGLDLFFFTHPCIDPRSLSLSFLQRVPQSKEKGNRKRQQLPLDPPGSIVRHSSWLLPQQHLFIFCFAFCLCSLDWTRPFLSCQPTQSGIKIGRPREGVARYPSSTFMPVTSTLVRVRVLTVIVVVVVVYRRVRTSEQIHKSMQHDRLEVPDQN